MTKLHRKLERRIPRAQGVEKPLDWLEVVERQEEQSEHCAKCGELIPAYAEGVCPQCLQQRKILWRLLGVGKPYRKRLTVALVLTFAMAVLAAVPAVLQGRLVDQAIQPKEVAAALAGRGLPVLGVSERVNNLIFWAAMAMAAIVLMEVIGMFRVRILAIVGTGVTGTKRLPSGRASISILLTISRAQLPTGIEGPAVTIGLRHARS